MRVLPLVLLVIGLGAVPLAAQAVTVQEIVDQISTTSYQSYLESTLPTHNGSNRCQSFSVASGAYTHGAQHDPTAEAVFLAFRRSGWTTSYLPFSLAEDGTGYLSWGRNIIAIKQGTTRPDDVYLLSGHYDSTANHESSWTTCPGADDDGSGVAALLEIARVTSQYNFPATIVLAVFDGEEQTVVSGGVTYRRVGSTYYSNMLQSQGVIGHVKGMISVDMIAWLTPYSSDPTTGEDLRNKVDIEARQSQMTTIDGQLTSAVAAYGGGLTINIRGNPGDYSDHVSFADKGVQAVQLIEDGWWSNPNYHHQTDSADTLNYINYPYAAKMLKIATGWLCTQALAP